MRMNTRLWTAAQAAAACSMVLDLIGVTNEVLAWTTNGARGRKPGFERTTPLRNIVVKRSSVPFHRAQHNFTRLALFDQAEDNIDGESILWGAYRLAERARRSLKRPILIVFSDGEPLSYAEHSADLQSHLLRSIERIEKAGVTTVGIGIQTDCVRHYYPSWKVVDDLDDLIPSFYDVLGKELRKSRKISR